MRDLTSSDNLCILTCILAIGAVALLLLGRDVPQWYTIILGQGVTAIAALALPRRALFPPGPPGSSGR